MHWGVGNQCGSCVSPVLGGRCWLSRDVGVRGVKTEDGDCASGDCGGLGEVGRHPGSHSSALAPTGPSRVRECGRHLREGLWLDPTLAGPQLSKRGVGGPDAVRGWVFRGICRRGPAGPGPEDPHRIQAAWGVGAGEYRQLAASKAGHGGRPDLGGACGWRREEGRDLNCPSRPRRARPPEEEGARGPRGSALAPAPARRAPAGGGP